MILIKQITIENYKEFKGLPVDILVRLGGDEVWTKSTHPPLGMVIWDSGRYYIQWQNGNAGHWYMTIFEMIERLHGSVSFYHIEIK
jgi:hypothetical protein